MENCIVGIFNYFDQLHRNQYSKIPEPLCLESTSTEGVLLRLLYGRILLQNTLYDRSFKQYINYTVLPYCRNGGITRKAINILINADSSDEETKDILNRYLQNNRKNAFVHEHILFEISSYFLDKDCSPISAFVHLYRCFEFISYSFPMIYASKTKDYMGSFNSLKKFLAGNGGELKFFRHFLTELFCDEANILSFNFETPVISPNLEELQRECENVFRDEFTHDFSGSTFSIVFENVLSLFITLRNRYFHMLVGQGQNNFKSTEYDINDLFHSLNPILMNWLSVIIVKIFQHGFSSELT